MKVTPILFVDLDDTIRKGPKATGKFVNGPADVEIFDGVVDILKSYKAKGWRIVAISNQGGIALGHVSDGEVARAMQETNRLCANLIDGMLWCPHHPEAADDDNRYCFCRKPKTALIHTAISGLHKEYKEFYRPDQCLFVGDMESDKACAENAGIPFAWAEAWREKGVI